MWLKRLAILLCLLIGTAGWYGWQSQDSSLTLSIAGARDANVASRYQFPATYDDHLSQLRPFKSDGGLIAYSDHGPANAATTIALIHGVPTSSWMYRKLIGQLDNELRVISIDLLGYGASAKPEAPATLYSHASQASYVAELLASLDIANYALLVHDMGGLVGWELLAAGAPISDFVLLNTIIHKEGFNHPEMDQGLMTDAVMMAYSTPMSSEMMLKSTFDELGLTQQHRLSEAECEGYLKPLQSGSNHALSAFFTSLEAPLFDFLNENSSAIAGFDGGWRVFWGMGDDILTNVQLNFLTEHADIPESQITLLPENSHFLAEEAPDVIAAGVLSFLGGDD